MTALTGTYYKNTSTHRQLCCSLQKLQCLSVCVCMLAAADSDAPSCSTASWRKKTSILFIVTRQDTKTLSPQQHPCWRLQELYVFLKVCVSMTAHKTDYEHVCISACVCPHNLCLSAFVCVWLLLNAVSRTGFYLHVNRTGPQRNVHPPPH